MEIFIVNNSDGTTTEWVLIDKGNGEFTSMPKALYDTLPSNSVDSAEAEKPKK